MAKLNMEQRFQAEMKKALTEMQFKAEISFLLVGGFMTVLDQNSPMALQITTQEHKELNEIIYNDRINEIELNYYQFSILNNHLQNISPSKIELASSAYYDMMQEAANLALKWNSAVQPIANAISDKIQQELKGAVAADLESKNGGLKVIKAEA